MATDSSRDRGRMPAALVVATALLGAALLCGCSTNVGDLPYPAVHDMPPARPNTTLSDVEQRKAEQDLTTARDSIEARAQQNAQATGQDSGQPTDTGSIGGKAAAAKKGPGQQTGGSRSQ